MTVTPRRWLSAAVVGVLLLVGLVQTLRAAGGFVTAGLPVLLLWPDSSAQMRQQLGPDLWNLLVAADAAVPRSDGLLLVTSGADPRHAEYVAFHRALYHLAPRPVWWTNPAPADGTWESRWWISSPLDASALKAVARDRGVSWLLFFKTSVPPGLDGAVPLTSGGWLVSSAGSERSSAPASIAQDGGIHILGLSAGLPLVFAGGWLLLGLAHRLGHRAEWGEEIVLAWPLGAGMLSVAMLWLDALGLTLDTQIWVVSALILLGALALAASRLRAARLWRDADRGRVTPSVTIAASAVARDRLASRGVEGLLVALLVLVVAYVGLLAVGRPLSYWDSWVTYAMKARILVLDGGISEHLIADRSRMVTHLDYPLLVPLVEAWVFRWAATLDDRLAGVVAVLYYAALLGVGYVELRHRELPRTLALGFVAALALVANLSGIALLVYADLPLAVYATIAAVYTARWLETRTAASLLIAAAAAGLMPWTKREGIVLFVALCLATLLVGGWRRGAWLAPAGLGGAALALSGPWWAFVAWNGVPNAAFSPLALSTLQANVDRAPTIAWYVARSVLGPGWSFIWLLGAVMSLGMAVWKWPTRGALGLLPATAALYLLLMSGGYVFSAFVPYQQHVVSSIDRLIAHVVALPLLWIACLLSRAGGADSRREWPVREHPS